MSSWNLSICDRPYLGELLEAQIHLGVLGLLREHETCCLVCAQPMCEEMEAKGRGGWWQERDTGGGACSIPRQSSTHLIQFQGVVTGLGEKRAESQPTEK